MSTPVQRSFSCHNCQGTIYIPYHLPPTSAPCPHCGTTVTSPAIDSSPVVLPAAKSAKPLQDSATEEKPEKIKIPVLLAIPEPETEAAAKPSSTPWIVSVFLLLLIAAAALLFYRELVQPYQKNSTPIAPAATKPAHVSSFQWQPQARELLRQFFAATTPEAKARCVIGGLATVDRLQQIWGHQLLQDSALDPNDFAAIVADPGAGQQTVFLMIYERPAQYDIQKFLRPLVSMEVMQGLETLDPLTQSLTAPENFETPPLRVQAYFKLVDGKLLLDYDTYWQTRHRTLQRFVDSAPPGAQETFRLILSQDVPLASEQQDQVHIYRITDPIHTTDSYRVFASTNQAFAPQLAVLHWHKIPNASIQHRPVTVTLTKRENQRIELSHLVCWEFEGLEASQAPAPPTPSPALDSSPLPPDP